MPTIQHFVLAQPNLRARLRASGVRVMGAMAIVIMGECIFRGVAQGMAWAATYPVAYALSAFYVLLCVIGLEMLLSLSAALGGAGGVFWIFSFVDRVKLQELGQPATPSDLVLFRQYLQVSYMLWGRWAYVFLGIGGLACLGLTIWMVRRLRNKAIRVDRTLLLVFRFVCITLAVALVTLPDYNYRTARFLHSPVADQLDRWNISNLNFDPATNVRVNGQLISFLMNTRSALAYPPQGYGEAAVAAALGNVDHRSTYSTPGSKAQPADDIIVIMSEALWDPAALPGVSYSDPLFAAAKYRARGTMFSPVFGGYTANTEFEFLTRVSNGILPEGSIPYVQYVTRTTDSLAYDLREAGYSAIALHPFDGSFWNRRNVYRDLGFQSFRDRDQFVHKDMTGPFINDHSLANEIIAVSEESAGPHFIFAVSLQGHSPYTGGMYRYGNRVEVNDPHHLLSADAHDQLRTYASGVRDAIHGFNEVVEHFEKSDRQAIVVMFGDHLPSLGDNYMVYRQTGFLKSVSQNEWTAQDQRNMHGVPLLIWSNLPADPVLPRGEFSPIYLSGMIKHYAGLQSSKLDELLARAYVSYPVLSQFYSQSSDSRVIYGMPTGSAPVQDYEYIAYDLLLGMEYAKKIQVYQSGSAPVASTPSLRH